MTLRELMENIKDSLSGSLDWFVDGWQKIANGDFLDLTVGQALVFSLLIFTFIHQIIEDSQESRKLKKLFNSEMKEAEQGNPLAQNAIGNMYYEGSAVGQDYFEAYKWFYIAELNGGEGGQNNREYMEKDLSPKKIEKAQKLAREWMEKRGAK